MSERWAARPWITAAIGIVEECHFPEYTFKVDVSRTGAVYLQATYLEPDTLTGNMELQHTRRWFLSPEMSRSEIVSTAFKCALTSMEHRTREWFLYNGRAIYQPHYDVDSLWAICEEREMRIPTSDGGAPFDAAVDRVIARVDKTLNI